MGWASTFSFCHFLLTICFFKSLSFCIFGVVEGIQQPGLGELSRLCSWEGDDQESYRPYSLITLSVYIFDSKHFSNDIVKTSRQRRPSLDASSALHPANTNQELSLTYYSVRILFLSFLPSSFGKGLQHCYLSYL